MKEEDFPLRKDARFKLSAIKKTIRSLSDKDFDGLSRAVNTGAWEEIIDYLS